MRDSNLVLFFSTDKENGWLSNWYLSDFVVDGITFHSGEQWFMYAKADLFKDEVIKQEILDCTLNTGGDNKKIKALGRKVRGFDDVFWERYREDLIFKGLYAKFSQDEDLRQRLLATGDKILVEASPYDKIWGIGLSRWDSAAQDMKQWKGLNLLGKVLMRVRSKLREEVS